MISNERKLQTPHITQPKKIQTQKHPSIISTKKKSLFPTPPREMVWKKINGKLVAEWISIDFSHN